MTSSQEDIINLTVTIPGAISLQAAAQAHVAIETVYIPGPTGPIGPSGNSNYVEVTADYYASFSDFFISVNCSNGPVTITLPISISSNKGQGLQVSKSDTTSYPVIIITQEGQLIDGVTTTFEILGKDDVFGMMSRGYGFKVF